MRKLSIAAVILLILGALITFALMNLGSLVNRNKDYILAQAEQALGRKVAVDDIGVTLWGGIGVRLKNFALADDRAFSREDFIRAADLQVNVELLPLLRKEVRVKRLILHDPVISVIRDKKGNLNFASIGQPGREPGTKPPAAAPPASPTALPLLVSLVDVADGEVRYLDKKEGVALRVSQIDLKVEDLGFDRPVSINLAAAVLAEKQNVRLRGQVGPLGPTVDVTALPLDATIEIDSLRTDELQRQLPQIKRWIPPGLRLSGPLQAKATVAGKGRALTLSGVELSAAVFGADKPNIKLTGRLGPLKPTRKDLALNGDLTLDPVSFAHLTRFPPLAAALPKEVKGEGPLSLSVHAEGTLDKLAVTAKMDATSSTLGFGDSFVKPQGVPLRLAADVRITEARIEVKKASAKLHTLDLEGSGTITRARTPTVRLSVDSSRADLAGWEKILPLPPGYDLAGRVEVHARITGTMKKRGIPQIKGSLALTGLRATLPQIPQPLTAKSATVTFTGRGAALAETPLRVGKSRMRLAARVESFTPLAVTHQLAAPELWLADFRQGNGTTKRPEVLRDATSGGRAWTKHGSLAYRGKFSSARGTVSDVNYTDLRALVSMAGQVVTIDRFSLRALNGTLQGQGRYDLRKSPPRFTLTSQVRGMNLAELFRYAAPATPQHVRGGVNLDLKLAGSGNQWQDIQRSLTGQGQAEVVKGAILDVNIAQSALTGLTGVPGLSLFISPKIRSKYPALFGTRNTEFGELKGSVNIRGGKVHLDNLLIAAADWAVGGKGWMTLDQMLNLRGQLVLSRQLSTDLTRDVKLLKYLADRQGRVAIPFTLAGTLPGVTPQPDVDYVARLVQRGLLQQGVEGLTKGLFKKPSPPQQAPQQEQAPPPPAQTTQPPKEKPEEQLLKGLKGIFGR
ncbi:MAG: AsmA family protein [Candidatus Methylomirabilales bacterium]